MNMDMDLFFTMVFDVCQGQTTTQFLEHDRTEWFVWLTKQRVKENTYDERSSEMERKKLNLKVLVKKL